MLETRVGDSYPEDVETVKNMRPGYRYILLVPGPYLTALMPLIQEAKARGVLVSTVATSATSQVIERDVPPPVIIETPPPPAAPRQRPWEEGRSKRDRFKALSKGRKGWK